MNSIRRPRRRPRGQSVNFRSLWWVVLREAALRVCYRSSIGTAADVQARLACSGRESARIAQIAWAIIRERPERRFFP